MRHIDNDSPMKNSGKNPRIQFSAAFARSLHNSKMIHYSSYSSYSSNDMNTFPQKKNLTKMNNSNLDQTEDKKKNKQNKNKQKQKTEMLRADRVVSNRTSLTRSQAFDALKSKRVSIYTSNTNKNTHQPTNDDINSKNNWTKIAGPKTKIAMDATLRLDGIPIPSIPPMLLLHHKPMHVLTSMKDDGSGRKHVGDSLSDLHVKFGMKPVGRLDYDTTGLLLFSNCGDLTQRLLHPRHAVEKEYVATVSLENDIHDGHNHNDKHDIDDENQNTLDMFQTKLTEILNQGVKTAEGIHTARVLDVRLVSYHDSHDNQSDIDDVDVDVDDDDSDDDDDDDVNNNHDNDDDTNNSNHNANRYEIRLVVTEGKHRMVRRMLANCGYPVLKLRRERHGNIWLGDLPIGDYRYPTQDELQWATDLINK